MKQAVVPSQYLQIALDLARRIAKGELPEGSRIYGRSVMASEYNVSPETIRRALRLLADMKVVEVKPQSGAIVLSADSARRYIANFEENSDVHALRQQLKDLMAEYAAKGSRLALSDAGAGAALLKGALQAASLNIYINAKSLQDRAEADRLTAEADRLVAEYGAKADEIFSAVQREIR